MTVTGHDASGLRQAAFRISGRPERLVPEHLVKAWAETAGVGRPPAVVQAFAPGEKPDTAGLSAPYAVKAFGDSIVHKTEVGAVRLGVDEKGLSEAVRQMTERLDAQGLTPSGFLIEEQVSVGVELILGVVRREPFGLMVLLGVGGSLTEAVARTTMRAFPVSLEESLEMIEELPELILQGGRSGSPIDRMALAEAILGVAGGGGLVSAIADDLSELEFNPITLVDDQVIALDARLVLQETRAQAVKVENRDIGDFQGLFSPRTVVVAGASASRSGFGNRFLQAYRQRGWIEGLFALHPTADQIDGVPCIASVGELDTPVDYLLAAVPADRVPQLVRDAAGRARFIHVISGGFSETGRAGQDREAEIVAALGDTGTRLIGPNCMGVYSPAGRQTFLLNAPSTAGAVSVLSQSGSLASEIIFDGAARGLQFGKLVSVGNAVDVTAGELLGVLATDPDTETVGMYVEGTPDLEFMSAARRTVEEKPLVLLLGGQSRPGAMAAASHTGALAADADVWAAVSKSVGFSVVNQMSHFVSALAYLQRHREPSGITARSTLLVGPGGGASVLAADAFARHGVTLEEVQPEIQEGLRLLGYGAGTSMRNPIEVPVGPATPDDAFERVLTPILTRQPYSDVVLHLNAQSWRGFSTEGFGSLIRLIGALRRIDDHGPRFGLVLRGTHSLGADGAAIVEAASRAGVVLFTDFDEAAAAVAAAQRHFSHDRSK